MDETQKVRKKKKVKSKSKKKQLSLEQNDGLIVVVGQEKETPPEVAQEQQKSENVKQPAPEVAKEPTQETAKEEKATEESENADGEEKAKDRLSTDPNVHLTCDKLKYPYHLLYHKSESIVFRKRVRVSP